jgi:three-Cys-motif partner protein
LASDYRPSAVDGLPCRVSGDWAVEKLAYLSKYMAIFNIGMKNRWQRVYLDLLAGPGRCVVRETNQEFEGSPLRALACEQPFTQTFFVESNERLAAALQHRVAGRGEVRCGDANDPRVIQDARDLLGHGRLGLAFVDNLGLDVALDSLRELSAERKLDLIITFQVGDLKRNVRDVLVGTDCGTSRAM